MTGPGTARALEIMPGLDNIRRPCYPEQMITPAFLDSHYSHLNIISVVCSHAQLNRTFTRPDSAGTQAGNRYYLRYRECGNDNPVW